MSESFKIITTPEWDALHKFDAENPVASRPQREIAREIAEKYNIGEFHPIVDDISHAIEDAREFGKMRGPFEDAAIASTKHLWKA